MYTERPALHRLTHVTKFNSLAVLSHTDEQKRKPHSHTVAKLITPLNTVRLFITNNCRGMFLKKSGSIFKRSLRRWTLLFLKIFKSNLFLGGLWWRRWSRILCLFFSFRYQIAKFLCLHLLHSILHSPKKQVLVVNGYTKIAVLILGSKVSIQNLVWLPLQLLLHANGSMSLLLDLTTLPPLGKVVVQKIQQRNKSVSKKLLLLFHPDTPEGFFLQ